MKKKPPIDDQEKRAVLSLAYRETIEKRTGCLVVLETGQRLRFSHRSLSESEYGFIGIDGNNVIRRLKFKEIASIKPLAKERLWKDCRSKT